MLQPPPSLTALFLESRSKLLETNGLGMFPSSYRYPEGQRLHGRQGRGAVESQGYRMAAYSKFPTVWKGRIQVPRLGTSFEGEGRLHKNCGDAVSFSPIPGSCGPGSGMLSDMVVGMLAHWACLEEQRTELEGGWSDRSDQGERASVWEA